MHPATDLRSILTRRAEEILEGYPDVGRLEIDDRRSRTALVFPRRNEDGFDVEVEAYPEELVLFTHGVHIHFDEHYDSELYDPEELVEQALGMARDLLSPDMRIRELRAGNRPYRWFMEYFDGTQWYTEQETGLLLWNYLGRRSERIFQNHTLPGRIQDEA